MGAVYFGALTYIGNAPNFMIKAIAEDRGIAMPSFFAYMAYAAIVMLPLLAVISPSGSDERESVLANACVVVAEPRSIRSSWGQA